MPYLDNDKQKEYMRLWRLKRKKNIEIKIKPDIHFRKPAEIPEIPTEIPAEIPTEEIPEILTEEIPSGLTFIEIYDEIPEIPTEEIPAIKKPLNEITDLQNKLGKQLRADITNEMIRYNLYLLEMMRNEKLKPIKDKYENDLSCEGQQQFLVELDNLIFHKATDAYALI